MEKSLCEEEVYNRVYRQNFEKLRNLIYYKCGDLDEAGDIAQESFIRLWAKCADVILEQVSGYVYTIANRLFLSKMRSNKVALKFEKSQELQHNTEDPLFLLRTDEFRSQIETAISELPEGQREAFMLNRIDKYTYKEIAEMLEISQTAVEKRITKALIKLRDKIEEFRDYKI